MIATLSSFIGQFDPTLIENARQLFGQGSVISLKKDGFVWQAEVNAVKNYKVSVRVEDDYVTDVFCICKPGVCVHTAAVMFALQKRLKIKPEVFQPKMLLPDPIYLVGPRINDLIYVSRQAGSKNGELEKLGASVSLKNPDYIKMRSMIRNQLSGYDNSPIFNGAKKLLGAAILAFEEENYPPVFMIARAILTEINTLDITTNSSNECCHGAAALMEELYNSSRTSAKLKEEIFEWVMAAWDAKLYTYFQKDLIPVITLTLQKKAHQEKALEKLRDLIPQYNADLAIADAKIRVLKMLGKEQDSKMVRYENLSLYREQLINEAFAKQDYKEVKKLARDATHGKSPSAWWEWIYKIAVIENDVVALRDYYSYKYYHEGYHHKYYDALRGTYSAEDWVNAYPAIAEKFEQLHAISKTEVFAVANIYLTEALPGKLALLLERFPWYDLATLSQRLLEKECPDLLKKILWDHLVEMSSNSTTREKTEALRREMKQCSLNSYWGKKLVNELRPYLLELHPTWKVFREELSKRL